MLRNIKLGTKMMIFFLLVGVIPATIIGVTAWQKSSQALSEQTFSQLESVREIKKVQITNFFNERKGDIGVLVETVSAFRREAMSKLTAVRETKLAAVKRYFTTIENQAFTLAEDRAIVDAMQAFRIRFRSFRDEISVRTKPLHQMRGELKTYYTGEFANEYKSQNSGKSPGVDFYFDQLDADAIALQYHYIKNSKHKLGSKHLLDNAGDGSSYSAFHEKVHPTIRNFLEKFGYYDIFLVDTNSGDIVYSVFKELDYATSLKDGPYAKTNFGEAFRKANTSPKGSLTLVDYKQYFPSYDAPAAFISTPVFDGRKRTGVLIFQMPIERLNEIMKERAGLGKTGETYLVGSDLLMRSDSYLDPDNHSVVASFRNPATGTVPSKAVTSALAGEAGTEIIIDYNGNPVLSAFAPVKIGNTNWAIMAEIDVSEAFSPKNIAGDEFFAKYIDLYGYYDLFLINPDGYIFYTATKESDFQTNIIDGKYAGSGLGNLIRKVVKSKNFGMADFKPYEPSNGDPAAFIAQPVVFNGRIEAIVALQLSIDAINGIMQQRHGMGETGETYLVGPDKLMRSDSFLDPVHHSVKASFANPSKGTVDTDGARKALAGATGREIILDYNGNSVLSAFAPVDIFGTKWGLLAEMDEWEAFKAIDAIERAYLLMGIICIVFILGSGYLVGRNIDNTVTGPVRAVIANLRDMSSQLSSSSSQIASSGQALADSTTNQAAAIEETAASLQQISSQTVQNAENASSANTLALTTRKQAEEGSEAVSNMITSMASINDASQEVAKIIKIIEEIAFQTNLLALNAAVEAARAGDHGKGFAVVAEEVRNLAHRSATAAKDTSLLIAGTMQKVSDGNSTAGKTGIVLNKTVENVREITNLVEEIASLSNQQASGVSQINSAVTDLDRVTQENAASSEEVAASSDELKHQASGLKEVVDMLDNLVNGEAVKGGENRAGLAPSRPALLTSPSDPGLEP